MFTYHVFSAAEKVITLMKYGSDDGLGFHIVGNHPTKVSTVIKGRLIISFI